MLVEANWRDYMKVYTFGDNTKPVMMLFPGTCCYWKNNFGHVIEGLKEYFYVAIVSYSGFDETEQSTFISELDETKKIEQYIQQHFNGSIFGAYGCSLGGSFVSLLVSRKNVHIDHAIIGSSDMDQTSKFVAKLQTAIIMPIIYPLITGKGSKLAKKFIAKRMNSQDENADYRKKFMEIMGIGSGVDFSFISKESMKNQFYSDLYTKVGTQIQVPHTTIHVFYAKKMGEKYRDRYEKYFKQPDIIEFDLRHEELLLDASRWVKEVCKACQIV